MEKDQTLRLSSALERVKMHHHIYEMYYVNKNQKRRFFRKQVFPVLLSIEFFVPLSPVIPKSLKR